MSTEKNQHADEKLDNAASDYIDFGGESSVPPPPTLTPEAAHRLWQKIDQKLMPILALMYLLSFMDRGKLYDKKSIYVVLMELSLVFYRKHW